MTADLEFTLQSLIAAVGWTLLDFLWQGALIGLAYVIARAVIGERRLPLRLAIGNLALIAFALTPVATLLGRLLDPVATSALPAQVGAAALQATITVSAVGAAPASESWIAWLVAAWLAGVAVLAGRGLLRWRATRRLCTIATPLADDWAPRIARLHRQLGLRVKVLVRESAQVVAPILVGWLKPVILLPVGLGARMPIDQIEVILAHELVHVRRLDVWANAAQIAIETLLFYHPVVAWLGRCVRQDRELCCDAAVADSGLDRLTYARALLSLAEDHRRPAPTRLALAATGGVLLNRIEHLLGVSPQAEARLQGLGPALVLAIGAALLALPTSSSWWQQRAQSWQPMLPSKPSTLQLSPLFDLVVRDLAPAALALPAIADRPAVDAQDREPTRIDVTPVDALATPLPTLALAEPPAFSPPGIVVPEFPTAAVETALAATPRLEAVEAQPLRVLRREAPYYPRSALTRGLEGSAALSFRIDDGGRPVDIRVESASQQMFATAAIAALRHWRFATDGGSSERQQQLFDFSLTGDVDNAGGAACQLTTGSRICRPTP